MDMELSKPTFERRHNGDVLDNPPLVDCDCSILCVPAYERPVKYVRGASTWPPRTTTLEDNG